LKVNTQILKWRCQDVAVGGNQCGAF